MTENLGIRIKLTIVGFNDFTIKNAKFVPRCGDFIELDKFVDLSSLEDYKRDEIISNAWVVGDTKWSRDNKGDFVELVLIKRQVFYC